MKMKLMKALAIVLATQAVGIAPVVNGSEITRHMAGVDVTEMLSLVITRLKGTEPVLESLGYKAERVTPYYEIITIPAAEAKDLIPHLERMENVRAVEKDYRTTYVPPEQITVTRSTEDWNYYQERGLFAAEGPNDTYFIDQAAWMEPHENLAGVSDILRAWKASEKVKQLRVAIVDSGFDSHPDLMWSEGINLNYPSDLADAQDYKRYQTECADVSNANYHGQQVGAVVGAISDNGYGVAGILDANMVAVHVAGCDGSGFLSATTDGIRWAAGDPDVGMYPILEPAKIINVSRGTGPGETDCPTYAQDAIDYAISRGSIVIISAGNYADTPSAKIAPGNCEGVITVANIGRSGEPSGSTSRGSAVELSAIGELVPAISPDGDEQTLMFGTSFSAPTTSGAFGLLWQQIPELSPDDVIKLARETARPLPGNPSDLGWGVVDPYRMLERATSLLSEAQAAYDHPERAGSVTEGLAQYLEASGYVVGACSAVEMDVETELDPGKHVVIFEVPEGEPLNRTRGTKSMSSQSTRFLTNINADKNSQYGYQICEDGDGQACSLDALIKVELTGIGQGQNCKKSQNRQFVQDSSVVSTF